MAQAKSLEPLKIAGRILKALEQSYLQREELEMKKFCRARTAGFSGSSFFRTPSRSNQISDFNYTLQSLSEDVMACTSRDSSVVNLTASRELTMAVLFSYYFSQICFEHSHISTSGHLAGFSVTPSR